MITQIDKLGRTKPAIELEGSPLELFSKVFNTRKRPHEIVQVSRSINKYKRSLEGFWLNIRNVTNYTYVNLNPEIAKIIEGFIVYSCNPHKIYLELSGNNIYVRYQFILGSHLLVTLTDEQTKELIEACKLTKDK